MVTRDMYKVIVQYWCKPQSAYMEFVESVYFSNSRITAEEARERARARVLELLTGDPHCEGEPLTGAYVERSDYGAKE